MMQIKKKLKWTREWTRVLVRDAFNISRFGRDAPLTAQQVFIDPSKIEYVYSGDLWHGELPESLLQARPTHAPALGGRAASGRVLGGDWDKDIVPLNKCPKYLVCQKRFIRGMSWEDAGAYELMRQILIKKPGADGCQSMADVVKRYENVDRLYDSVKRDGRLRSRKELHPGNFRERGGVYVHFDRRGNILFSGGGFHRLSVAQIVGLRSIPAQVGVVHEQAIPLWKKTVIRASCIAQKPR